MTFERTRDWELIRSVITHPQIYPHIGDDFAPAPADWQPIRDELAYYLLAKDDAEVLGIWALFPLNRVCWWVHTCLLPNSWGERALQAAKGAIAHVFAETECCRLITEVPACNRLAFRFAVRSGMTEFGRNLKCYKKRGVLEDVYLLGISKSEA